MRGRRATAHAYRCFHRVARMHGRWAAARRYLEKRAARGRGEPAAQLVLGLLALDRGGCRPEPLLRAAVAGFQARHDRASEVEARLALVRSLTRRGRLDNAMHELRRAERSAIALASPLTRAQVEVEKARLAIARSDYGVAIARLRLAEAAAPRKGHAALAARIQGSLGLVLRLLGRNREAIGVFRRQQALLRAEGDRFGESAPLLGILLARAMLLQPQKELLPLLAEALRLARSGGNVGVEAQLRLCLGQARTLSLRERLRETERALSSLRRLGDVERTLFAMRQLADLQLESGASRDGAFQLARSAIRLARTAGLPFHLARGMLVLAQMRWRTGPRERAIEDSLRALDAIEAIRGHQRRPRIRARVNSEWAYFYYRFAHYVLRSGRPGTASDRDLELVFRIGERLRARGLMGALRDSLPRGTASPQARRLLRARRGVRSRISALQRRLLQRAPDPQTTRSRLRSLAHLEARLSILDERLARSLRPLGGASPTLPTLRRLRQTLAPDQAMVVYHLPADVWYRSASLALVISRRQAAVYPIENAAAVEKAVRLFPAAVARRDRAFVPGAARLFRDLLERPLSQLGSRIRRLVLVPDGVLHRLPFAALRASPQSALLGARYEITVTPSAALWMRWERARPRRPAALLAFANPSPLGNAEAPALSRAIPWLSGWSRMPLPRSLEEVREAARLFGEASAVLAGAAASEATFKATKLRRYGMIHFATHAVVDEARPQYSALVLAPGAPNEDGLLQAREIADLTLRGQVVVLSACRSSSGPALGGEGVLSLARGFLEAGAHAVLANLWSVRDDESQRLMKVFYRQLARGHSLGRALLDARRERIAAGAPPAAWAGIVLIGNGDIVPLPGARPSAPPWGPAIPLAGVALAVGGLAALLWRLRRSRSPTGQ